MTNSNNFAETTIVGFHIGRGGHFWNAGHLSFIGETKIGKYTDSLFLSYENAYNIGVEISDRENLQAKFQQALEDSSDAIAFFEKIGRPLGDKLYVDGNGSPVGLTEYECMTGVGRINLDNDYNTTYTCYLSDCNEKELQLIVDYDGYVGQAIVDYAKEQLGVEDATEEEAE